MSPIARADTGAPAEPRTPEQEAAVKAAGAWINHLARTLKTCRLYDAQNPTVVRFRNDLGLALRRLLDQHGPVRYEFTSNDVVYDGASLYPARSRDDNLALAFYRDGVRAITFLPGIELREMEQLLDCVLLVSGQNAGDDDLITLLWEVQLQHLEVDYVPAEGDVGAGTAEDESGPLMPWPTGAAVEEAAPEAGAEPESPEVTHAGSMSRSDDWTAGDLTVEIEAGFDELQALAPTETVRLRNEYEAEKQISLVTATVALSQAYLAAGATDDDRGELARFLPRVLRQAVANGTWLEARETLLMLRTCGSVQWTAETFVQELLQPISIANAVEKLDAQESVIEFVAFARQLGDQAVDWLSLVLAESQNKRHRRALAEAIADVCRDAPERLAPWISDPRWFVVRNVVHILGRIGGPGIVGLLQTASRHSDVRVRQEVVTALSRVELRLARGTLVRLLDGADTRTFSGILHQLAGERDPATAKLLLRMLQDPAFEQRPLDEQRSIHLALAAAGGDEVVPELEAELHKGNWFARGHEDARLAIARVLARVGTPLAKMVLERGAQSKRAPIRKACEEALMGMTDNG